MTVVERPGRGRPAPWWGPGLGVALGVVAGAAIVVVTTLAVRSDHGSGVAATEHRGLAPFSAVELAGENTVTIRVGPAQSVAVTADDDLIQRVTTTVRNGRLVVANEGGFTTAARMSVAVTVPSLDRVVLSGSGTVSVVGVRGTDFVADLSGTGTVAASGTVDHLTAVLSDTGTVDLQGLIAREAVARMDGTGMIGVHATSTLDATLTGTGSIVYSGSPSVRTHNTGTGTVTAG
jgi:Putative auto-transporter adhesin, head GIN domain